MDASQYLQVYDTDLIYSWTPREFKNFIKGARLRDIDRLESSAIGAMFNARASNGGRMTAKKLFDADKARKQIDSVEGKGEAKKDLTRYHAAKAAMKNYRPQGMKKGG